MAKPMYDGFSEGSHGRGPNPYSKGMSHHGGKARSSKPYEADRSRGDTGIHGSSNDQHKGFAHDVTHPASHSEFEQLGHKE